MDGYVAKPIRGDELLDAVGTLTETAVTATAAGAAPPPAQGIVDWTAALRAVRGDQRLLRVVVEAAAKEIPSLVAAIAQAVDTQDAAQLQLSAHTLKGAIRYFASGEGFQQVQRLEKMGRDQNLQCAAESLAALQREAQRLVPALLGYLHADEGRHSG